MSADLLLYLIVAAGLVFWLKTILGTTDDEEEEKREQLHRDMKKASEEGESFLSPIKKKNEAEQGNVVRLNALSGENFALPRHVRFDNKTAENNLTDIMQTNHGFDLSHFLSGAEYAFTMIIEAFATGDLDTLKDVLDKDVYKGFESAIKARNKSGESVETQVQSIEKMEIVEAFIKKGIFFITIRFTANEICVIRDKAGEIISGAPDKPTQMVDVWVFGQPEAHDGPEWFLYETRDDAEEDHKTPIPEAGDSTGDAKE